MSKMRNLLFEVSSNLFIVSYFENDSISKNWSLDISSKSEFQKKEVISDFLVKEGITLLDYSNVLVLWSNQQSVMIPSKLLDYTKPDSIIRLSFGNEIHSDEFDFNRIPLLGAAIIYTVPLWVKSLFVLKFTGSKIIHRTTSTIHYLAAKNSLNKLIGLLNIEDGFISFIVFRNDQPISFIQNNYEALEDILYFISYTLQNLDLPDIIGKIDIVNLTDNINSEQLLSNMKKLALFPKITWEENSLIKNEIIRICV
jgi:hypothetical protein